MREPDFSATDPTDICTHSRGRVWQVRRGERGIKILVPMKVREPRGQTTPDAMPQDPGPSADPASVRRRLLFGVGTVFDISQTDGEPLATIDVPVLTGTDGAALYGRMEAVARKDGLTVEPETCDSPVPRRWASTHRPSD